MPASGKKGLIDKRHRRAPQDLSRDYRELYSTLQGGQSTNRGTAPPRILSGNVRFIQWRLVGLRAPRPNWIATRGPLLPTAPGIWGRSVESPAYRGTGISQGVLGMNESQAPQPEQFAAVPPPPRRADPLRRWTLIVVVIFVLLFGWTLIADRLTPYTSDASVRSFVVRIVPEISGKVTEVAVQDNQIVHTGDLLFRIDQTPVRIAVESAEAKLTAAGPAVGVSTAAVDAAQAQLVEQICWKGTTSVSRRGARLRAGAPARLSAGASRPGTVAVRRGRGTGAAGTGRAGAGAPGARPEGRRQPRKFAEALAALEQGAALDLNPGDATLLSPGWSATAWSPTCELSIGQLHGFAGQPSLTFLDSRLVWLNAFLRENSLEYIRPGEPAEVVLDVLPGRVLPARVDSVGWGVGEN